MAKQKYYSEKEKEITEIVYHFKLTTMSKPIIICPDDEQSRATFEKMKANGTITDDMLVFHSVEAAMAHERGIKIRFIGGGNTGKTIGLITSDNQTPINTPDYRSVIPLDEIMQPKENLIPFTMHSPIPSPEIFIPRQSHGEKNT